MDEIPEKYLHEKPKNFEKSNMFFKR